MSGKADPENDEIRKTDGRYRKNSPYQTVQLTEQYEILTRLKGMKILELKQEILRLEIENKELKRTGIPATKGVAIVIYSNSKRVSLERMSAGIISLKDRIQD